MARYGVGAYTSGTPARPGRCAGSFVALGGSREDAGEMRKRYQH